MTDADKPAEDVAAVTAHRLHKYLFASIAEGEASQLRAQAKELDAALVALPDSKVFCEVFEAAVRTAEQSAKAWALAAERASHLRGTPPGEKRRPGPALLAELFRQRPALRLEVIGSTDPRSLLSCIQDCLGELDLEVDEVAALLLRLGAPAGVWLRPSVVAGWAEAHSERARELVELWLAADTKVSSMSPAALADLVKGAVRALPDNAWRDHVLAALGRRRDEASWDAAVALALEAWASPTPPVSTRHEAMFRQVERCPSRLARAGLAALRSDARDHPAEVFVAALEVVDLVDGSALNPSETVEVATSVLDTLCIAMNAPGVDIEGLLVARALPILLVIPPRPGNMSVDHYLAQLLSLTPTHGFVQLGAWLAQHAMDIVSNWRSFEDLLPYVAQQSGPEKVATWLLDLLRAPTVPLRMLAARFVQLGDVRTFPARAIAALSATEAEAVAHQILGCPLPRESVVDTLLGLLDARPELAESLGQMLVEDVVDLFPATSGDRIEKRESNQGRVATQEVLAVEARMKQRLAERSAALLRRRLIPELKVTSPGRVEEKLLWHRISRREARRAQSQSILSVLATQICIAEGTEMVDFGTSASTPLQRVDFSAEFPASGLVDRLGARLRQQHHLERAEALLAHGPAT